MINGITGALIELFLFFTFASEIKKNTNYQNFDNVSYYWLSFTVLTGLWEASYIINYNNVINIAQNLIQTKTHVWTTEYNLSMINPINFSKYFYAEYGAWADREYISKTNVWSRIIEGTHATLCGFYSLLALILYEENENSYKFYMLLTFAMASQLMNSILYMGQYMIQTHDPSNPNFNSPAFPCGILLTKRIFMWVNVFWTILPIYVLCVNYNNITQNMILFPIFYRLILFKN